MPEIAPFEVEADTPYGHRMVCRSFVVIVFLTVSLVSGIAIFAYWQRRETSKDPDSPVTLSTATTSTITVAPASLSSDTSTTPTTPAMNLTVISVAASMHADEPLAPDFERKTRMLQARFEKRGFVHKVLRFSGDFDTIPGFYAERMRRYHEVTKQANDNDLLLFLDAFDVIALGTPAKVIEVYHDIGQGILFGCQYYQWPRGPNNEVVCPAFQHPIPCRQTSRWGCDTPKTVRTGQGMTPCAFVCGGTILARAEALRQLFDKNPWPTEKDDQCYLNERLRQNWTDATLDTMQRVFKNTVGQLGISPSQVLQLSPQPVFIHLDGSHPTVETLQQYLDATDNSVEAVL